MAVSTCTLVGNIKDLSNAATLDTTGRQAMRTLVLYTNVTGGAPLVDVAGNTYRLNGLHVTVGSDGSINIPNVILSDSTGLNIGGGTLQYQLRSTSTSRPFVSSWFTLTASMVSGGVIQMAAAEAAQALPPSVVSAAIDAVNAAGASIVDDAEAARDAAEGYRDDAAAITAPLTAPANSQVASYINSAGATKDALTASTAAALVAAGVVTATISGDPADPDVTLYLNGVEL